MNTVSDYSDCQDEQKSIRETDADIIGVLATDIGQLDETTVVSLEYSYDWEASDSEASPTEIALEDVSIGYETEDLSPEDRLHGVGVEYY